MKYLGKYPNIKHLLERGQYYLIYYQDNLCIPLSTKSRMILLVKYIGRVRESDRVSILIIYENTYKNDFLKSVINNEKNTSFFKNDDIFSLNEYDMYRILMELI